MDIILKIYSILNLKQIRRCSIIIVAMILGAILEAIGIGAILPLISIMGNPDFLTVYPKVTAVIISVNKVNIETMIREKTITPPELTFLSKVAVL